MEIKPMQIKNDFAKKAIEVLQSSDKEMAELMELARSVPRCGTDLKKLGKTKDAIARALAHWTKKAARPNRSVEEYSAPID